MNLPENISETARKVYELLSGSQSPKSIADIAAASMPQPAADEGYKAISTADSLVVKGIITVEKAADSTQQDFYTLVKSADETGPSEEADANEEYAKKTDTNEEEKRVIAIFEQPGDRLPAAQLFKHYLAGQTDEGNTKEPSDKLSAALKELTDAGLVIAEGDMYSVKKTQAAGQ